MPPRKVTKKKLNKRTGTTRRSRERIEFVAPTVPNDHLIRDAIGTFNLSDSKDGPKILALLQNHQQNLDTIQDDELRAAKCFDNGWTEPTDVERVEIVRGFMRSSGNEKGESEWRSCLSADGTKLVDRQKYHKLREQRLCEQIRQIRRKVRDKERQLQSKLSAQESILGSKPLSVNWADACIDARPIRRIPTGNQLIDEFFGYDIDEKTGAHLGGLTEGHTYLIGAEKGLGKTRWLVDMCARLCGLKTTDDHGRECGGLRGLYIQGEETPERFAKMFASQVWEPDIHDIHLSDTAVFMRQHESLIKQLHPDIIVIDSKDMMEDWRHPRDAENSIKTYNRWAEEYSLVVFIISHINAKGEIKGGTNLPHLVRSVILGTRAEHNPQEFSFMMDKNRGSQARGILRYVHGPKTVELVDPKGGHSVVKTTMSPDMAILAGEINDVESRPVSSALLDAVNRVSNSDSINPRG